MRMALQQSKWFWWKSKGIDRFEIKTEPWGNAQEEVWQLKHCGVAQYNLPHCNWKPRKNKLWWPQGLPGICKDSVHASHHQPLLIKVWKSVAVKIWDHFDSHAPHIIQSIHSVLVKFLATRQQVWPKMPRPSIPEDKINLRLILVSGKTKDYLFRPSDSAGEIAQYVFDNWPIGKSRIV